MLPLPSKWPHIYLFLMNFNVGFLAFCPLSFFSISFEKMSNKLGLCKKVLIQYISNLDLESIFMKKCGLCSMYDIIFLEFHPYGVSSTSL